MTKHTGTFCAVLAGQDAPDDFFEKMIEEFPSVTGFAAAEGGVLKVDGVSDGSVTLEQIKEICEDYKDTTCFFHFGKFPDKFNENSCQPFTLVDENVVVFMDGNFEEKAISKDTLSPEFDVFTKYLKPNILRIWKGAGGDVAEFMQELTTDPTIPDLINTWYKGRASVCILASNGEFVTFGENALYSEWDWGWSTNPGTYGKKTVVEQATATVKRGFGNARRAVASVTAGQSKVPATGPTATSDADKYHAPSPKLSKAEKTAWYVENNEGVVPPGYKDCPKILKMEFRPIKTLNDPKVASSVAANRRPIAEVVPARGKAVTSEVIPVLSPAQLGKLKTFAGTQTTEGRKILDPKRLQEMEKEFATFCEQAGLNGLEDTFHWTYEGLIKLGKDVGIEALALLCDNYSYAYQELLAEAPVEEQEEVEEKEVVEQPVVQPARRGGFSNRKVS